MDERTRTDFTAFASARWPALVRSAVLLGCSLHEAEDLAQATLMRCLLKWKQVRRADDPDGTRYRLEGLDPAGTAIGVGRPVALGTVPACATFEIDGSTFGARGAVAPIGLFSANEMPVAEELTVTVGSGEVRRLHPVP